MLPEFSPGLLASRFQPQAGTAPGRAVGVTLADCSPRWEVPIPGHPPSLSYRQVPWCTGLGEKSPALGKNGSSCMQALSRG